MAVEPTLSAVAAAVVGAVVAVATCVEVGTGEARITTDEVAVGPGDATWAAGWASQAVRDRARRRIRPNTRMAGDSTP